MRSKDDSTCAMGHGRSPPPLRERLIGFHEVVCARMQGTNIMRRGGAPKKMPTRAPRALERNFNTLCVLVLRYYHGNVL